MFDASTTDISEIVIHSHEQPTKHACLACIYRHVEDEDHRDRHIAETLGLTLDEVKAGLIDEPIAKKLAESFPQLRTSALVGTAFDSLHKALCAEQALAAPGVKQAAAPFAFVSNLAGVLLALELYRHQVEPAAWRRSNYMFVSPWTSPHAALRRLHQRLPSCEFCSAEASAQAIRTVWPELSQPFGSF